MPKRPISPLVTEGLTPLSQSGDTGGFATPEYAPEVLQNDTSEEGLGLARSLGDNVKDLASPLETIQVILDKQLVTLLPNGDARILLDIREGYVQALLGEAASVKKTLAEYVQEMLDWWLENEFTVAKR